RPLLSRAHRSLPAAHRRARARPTGRAARLPRDHRGRARAVRRAAILLAVLALLAGCASRRLVRHGQVNEDALETVRRGLVALRGLGFTTPVPVLALSRDGLGAVVKEEIEQSYAPGDIEHAEGVYTRLGLLPPGTKLRPALEGLYQQEGAGFYDPRTKRLVVAESVPGAPSVGAGLLGFLTGRDLVSEFLVAHELTHALQDQHYHLPTRPEPLLDGHGDRDRPTTVTLGGTDGLEASGFTRILEDTIGELGIRVLATHALPAERAAQVAEGWGGDRLRALARRSDLVLVWMTAWDSPADAGEFAEAMPGLVPEARVEQREERVLVLVGPPRINRAALARRVWGRTTAARPRPGSAGSRP